MTNKCWCEEPLVTVLLRTRWRAAGVQPMLRCPEHGDPDSRASLEARAKKAEADAETAWGIIKRIARSLPEGMRPFELYATPERVAEVVALLPEPDPADTEAVHRALDKLGIPR